jgi:geranylgeranyl diphosphate synthase type II
MQNLNQLQKAFESYLLQHKFVGQPSALYEPVNYILALGGKRLRPAVLLAAHQLFDNEVEKSLPAALAVEVFHNFSLVHDDIMDAAPLRRGQPTVHQQYGLNAGILSGDVMLVKSYDLLLQTDTPARLKLLDIFTKMAVQVCEGQQMDMDFETQKEVTIPEYLDMIRLKTAVLLASALEMGALIGGSTEQDARLLYDFGLNLGIAFQLQDDILDAFGDPLKFGKKIGGDIAQNKKTYLYLKALEIAPAKTAYRLKELYTTTFLPETEKIREVLQIFMELEIRQQSEVIMKNFWEASLHSLQKVGIDEGRKGLLEDFAKGLIQRDH